MNLGLLSARTDWLGVGINACLLIIAAWAAIFACRQAAAAKTANALTRAAQREAAERAEQAAQQAIDDSRRANRPYLWVEVVPSLSGPPSWDLVIRNGGRTVARDIILDTAWPDPGDKITDALHQHLTQPFDLGPGSALRVYWRIARPDELQQTAGNPNGMSAACEVTLHYRGDDPALDPFVEPHLLDGPQRAAIIPRPQEGSRSSTSDQHLKALRDIDHALRALNVHVGGLRD